MSVHPDFKFTGSSKGQSVHGATRRTLLKVKGFSEVKVEKIKEAIAKCQASLHPYIFTSSASFVKGLPEADQKISSLLSRALSPPLSSVI